MDDGPSLARQLAEERERDHALATPRPALNQHCRLRVRSARAVHRMADSVEGITLLVQQDEHFATLHFLRGQRHQLLRRGDFASEQCIRGVGAIGVREGRSQVVDELTASLPGEELGCRTTWTASSL